ncbi:hypothetical protein FJM67_08185 [Maribrevibacterium harenarium]|uniref:Esterase n=1 Tax=Maribrevibacterium harenarium TaxID=2589817 RepID=A0A501WWY6_9GAMM|nr:YqiA/YcfP family alpha/beta fold hydrolase [Maribrevibacterium harenarium]TPE51947.1 hypothetical protein FJM67_08185 [Maribrevibacterium harenarium]
MLNILYLHGFASYYKPHSDKVQALTQLGNVIGLDLDYSQGSETVIRNVLAFAAHHRIDLVVGCSLGGWLAAQVAHKLNIPFVSLNPSLYPNQTLHRYLGDGVTFDGKPFHMSEAVVRSYSDMFLTGKGLVLLQKDDEILDAELSHRMLSSHFEVHLFEGGSHRFDGLNKYLYLIDRFIHNE